MKFYNFEIVWKKNPKTKDTWPTPRPCLAVSSNGRTVEEARHNIREAIQQHLAVLKEHDRHATLENA